MNDIILTSLLANPVWVSDTWIAAWQNGALNPTETALAEAVAQHGGNQPALSLLPTGFLAGTARRFAPMAPVWMTAQRHFAASPSFTNAMGVVREERSPINPRERVNLPGLAALPLEGATQAPIPSEQREREGGQGGKTPSSGRRQTAATALKNLPLEGATQAPIIESPRPNQKTRRAYAQWTVPFREKMEVIRKALLTEPQNVSLALAYLILADISYRTPLFSPPDGQMKFWFIGLCGVLFHGRFDNDEQRVRFLKTVVNPMVLEADSEKRFADNVESFFQTNDLPPFTQTQRLLAKAVAPYLVGNTEPLWNIYRQALETDPNDEGCLFFILNRLLALASGLNRLPEAVLFLDSLIPRIKPGRLQALALYFLGAFHMQMAEARSPHYAAAEAVFHRSLEQHDSFYTHAFLAHAIQKQTATIQWTKTEGPPADVAARLREAAAHFEIVEKTEEGRRLLFSTHPLLFSYILSTRYSEEHQKRLHLLQRFQQTFGGNAPILVLMAEAHLKLGEDNETLNRLEQLQSLKNGQHAVPDPIWKDILEIVACLKKVCRDADKKTRLRIAKLHWEMEPTTANHVAYLQDLWKKGEREAAAQLVMTIRNEDDAAFALPFAEMASGWLGGTDPLQNPPLFGRLARWVLQYRPDNAAAQRVLHILKGAKPKTVVAKRQKENRPKADTATLHDRIQEALRQARHGDTTKALNILNDLLETPGLTAAMRRHIEATRGKVI